MVKQFNNTEKALITSIYNAKDSNNYVLTNVFQKWLDTPGIRFDLEHGQLVFDYEIYKDAEILLNIKKEIISTALLIKYLEENSYIYIIQDETSGEQPSYIGAQKMSTPLVVPIPQEIAMIIKRTLYTIYVSYSLISFVENGFRTYEDLQLDQAAITLKTSKRQLCISRWSLIVSALALVCSLLISHCSNCTQNKHNETMLNTLMKFEANYFALNNQNTLDVCAHIDSLGVSFNQHNTQNVVKTSPKRVTVKKQYNLIQIDTINCDGKQYLVLPIKK